jgi:hypothetical protein
MTCPRLRWAKWPWQWKLPAYVLGIPRAAVLLIALLAVINGIVWAATGIVLRMTTTLGSLDHLRDIKENGHTDFGAY